VKSDATAQPTVTRRDALRLFGALAIGSAVGLGCSTDTSRRAHSIKVGLVYPLKGEYGVIGTDMRDAWNLWLDQHDGVIGGRELETVERNEGESVDTGVAAVQSVLDADVDVIVGVVSSLTANGAKSLVDAAQKLLIVANAGGADLTGSDRSQYVWRTSFTNAQVSLPLGKHVAGLPDVRTVFAAAPNYAAGHEAIAGFKAGFEANGGGIVTEQLTTFPGTTNFQPVLTDIRASGANAVYCFYAGTEAIGFVKQFDEFGLRDEMPLFASGFLTEGTVLEAQGDAALGIQTSLHYSTELKSSANDDFVAAFAETYGRAPTVFAVQMWDSALVLDRAVSAAGDVAADALVEALGGLGEIEDSPRGPWSFDGQTPKESFYLREVVEGEDGSLVNSVRFNLGEFSQPDP
jgi:branched-chain amino acid transport system substrate-binding protein